MKYGDRNVKKLGNFVDGSELFQLDNVLGYTFFVIERNGEELFSTLKKEGEPERTIKAYEKVYKTEWRPECLRSVK